MQPKTAHLLVNPDRLNALEDAVQDNRHLLKALHRQFEIAVSRNCLMTKKEAAAYLHIGMTPLNRLMAAGELKYFKKERAVRFRKRDLDDYIEKNLHSS